MGADGATGRAPPTAREPTPAEPPPTADVAAGRDRVTPHASRAPYLASKGGRVFPSERYRALRVLLEEAKAGNIEIRADEEAVEYLDWVAAREGIPPDHVHAVTLGDLIFVRPEHATNVRVLREEMIHVMQQRAGAVAGGVEAEISARLVIIRYRHRWSITADELREMIKEIRAMRKTGRY